MSPTFSQSDLALAHLDTYVSGISDPFIVSRYTGYVAVTAVTAFEINIREKIFEFCRKKHNVFGNFADAYFAKTNAKVKTRQLQDDYLNKFGLRYVNRYKRKMEDLEQVHLRDYRKSLKGSYNNLVQWRHDFVHDGKLPDYATYADACDAYVHGKKVIEAFFETLVR